MPKPYFHNSKPINENKNQRKNIQNKKVEVKDVVNINILLNRVKIEKKKETKQKIFLCSFTLLTLTIFGIFILIIK